MNTVPAHDSPMVQVEALALDPDTPVEQLLQFRDKHHASLGRMRASLADLAQSLRADASPTALLGAARDTYLNRVVPSLGGLESVLAERHIRFFAKSLVSASAIALAPIEPTQAVEKGAKLTGQTLDYAFAREKLIRDHPFGYLHRVRADLGADPIRSPLTLMDATGPTPSEALRQLFLRQDPRDLVASPLGGSRLIEFVELPWEDRSEETRPS